MHNDLAAATKQQQTACLNSALRARGAGLGVRVLRAQPQSSFLVFIAAVLLTMLFASPSYAVDLKQKIDFNIPAQDLSAALIQFSQQAHLQVIVSDDLTGQMTLGIKGQHAINEALQQLLGATGLNFHVASGTSITIAKGPKTTLSTSEETEPPPQRVRYAQASNNVSDSQASEPQGSDRKDNQPAGKRGDLPVRLEEVVVSAQKKTEHLLDVPVPVSVLGADELMDRNQSRLQDYYATVPGLGLTASGSGTQYVVIRGIATTINANPTVGTTIDDVPFGSSNMLAAGGLYPPDLDPADLSRVEVLKGPQGTLYGASSIGGLLKFVTADPSTEGVSGRVQLLGQGTAIEGGGLGYAVRGGVNVPLSDTVAVRASGFTRRDPGYINNVLTGEDHANSIDAYGGLLSLLWRPSDTTSLKINALLQDTRTDLIPIVGTDNSLLHPLFGDLREAQAPGTGGYDIKAELYSATLRMKFGSVEFTSVSGYNYSRNNVTADVTRAYGGAAGISSYFPGVPGLTYAACSCSFETDKFSQELRLSSEGQRLDWLAGAFYTHERSPSDQSGIALIMTGMPVGAIEDFNFPSSLSEYALFGTATLHFTKQFDVQVGGRESWNHQVYNETDSGLATQAFYGVPSPLINPTERSSANSFTYLLTPSYKISPGLMVYARFASGYRVGGPNYNAVADGIPAAYAPDKTRNYEVGLKAEVLDRALTIDTSIYYIDWRDIQISLTDPHTGFAYIGNGGAAQSKGVELSLQSTPVHGLHLGAAMSAGTAKLRQDLPAASTAVGFAGDRLPYSSRFSGNLSVQQDVHLTGSWSGFAGAVVTYVGSREGEFLNNGQNFNRFVFPSYTQADLRVGVTGSEWTISLFANNLLDERGILGGKLNANQSKFGAIYIQPRTVGLSLSRKL